MSSIGALSFINMIGPQLPALASHIEAINRPGVDGEAFRENAKKVEGIQVQTTTWVVSSALANAAIDNYSALKGSLVTVIDDNGRTVNNVMVLDVIVNRITPILISSPLGYSHSINATWYLKPTA